MFAIEIFKNWSLKNIEPWISINLLVVFRLFFLFS
tara:strand:+ start:2745 stop:2849 length:105 start_codon:yes stop_codon:yes gene_type:complete